MVQQETGTFTCVNSRLVYSPELELLLWSQSPSLHGKETHNILEDTEIVGGRGGHFISCHGSMSEGYSGENQLSHYRYPGLSAVTVQFSGVSRT